MQQARASKEDLRLEVERGLVFKGSALVRFEYLKWNEYVKLNPQKRRPDPEHVDRVKRIFRKAGCRPLETKHHIPALVSQQELDTALEDARRKDRWKADALPGNYATINTPDGYPELEFPGGVECLRGLHRIEAGKEWLLSDNKWWILDLYLWGISQELSTVLNEEYSNKENPCDGEIYRKIRKYEFLPGQVDSQISPATCVSLEMLWWARFNKSREKKLRTLFGKCERSRRLAASFDALTKIPGLFDAGMMVTTLNKVMTSKCYEEICHYNERYIFKVWAGFMKGIGNGFQRIDKTTVKKVERMAPGVSTVDAQSLKGVVLEGAIFSGFTRQERETIWNNIRDFKGIIPSLSKFFQDVHLLQACVNSIRLLVTVPPDQTLFTALGEAYTQRDTQIILTSATTFRSERGSRSYCTRLAYLGLFAMAMQEYRSLPKAPGAKALKEMPRAKADREALERFASFADLLGFKSPEIDLLKVVDCPAIKMLKEDLGHPSHTDAPNSIPISMTTGPGEDIRWRWGLPRTNAFREDKNYLYLDNLYQQTEESGEGITSFFVLKSWFTAFFGPWPGPALSSESPNHLPPLHRQDSDAEDVNMGPDIPSQRQGEREEPFVQGQEPYQLNIDEQEIEPSTAAGGTVQEEDTSQVPTEPAIQRDAQISGNTVVIRFVELDSRESNTMPLPPRYAAKTWTIQVEYGDPTSLIAQRVNELIGMGKRVCDKNRRYVPAEECYNIATSEGNTLFVIADIESNKKQSHDVQGGHVLLDEHMQDPQEQLQETAATNDDDESLLHFEQHNATNAYILDTGNTMIHLKKRLGDSHDALKPAEAREWIEVESMDVSNGDPQGIVARELKRIWQQTHLKPHDKNLRTIEYEDCYKVAIEAADHTLYLMAPSSQTEGERASESTWVPALRHA